MTTMLLPIDLTEAERLLVLSDLSTKLTALEALYEEKKAIPERIKSLMGAINHLNHSIATNTVEREVEVRDEPNAFGGTVKVYRVDTGAFVKERAMDPDERQLRLGDSAVPGPDNVRDLHARPTDEQIAAATPEQAEQMRADRLAAEREQRMDETIAGLQVVITDRGDGTFVAGIEAGVPGLAGGLSGPIRDTEEAARAELLDEVRRLMAGSTSWDDVAAASAEAARLAEIERLAAEQEADAAKGPKKLLRSPKKAPASKRVTVTDEADTVLATGESPDAVDTTPPDGAAF